MSKNINTEQKHLSINDLFKTMNLSDTSYSCDIALRWLESHDKKFYGFVDGQYLKNEKFVKDLQTTPRSLDVLDYFSNKKLCQVYIPDDTSLLKWTAGNSVTGFSAWSNVDAIAKSKILNDIANNIEKQQDLLSIVEALSSGKHLYKAKREISNLIESFKYYAGCVMKFPLSVASGEWHPLGPVCVVPDEYNNPSLTLNFRTASLLASGNSVLLLTHAHCSLSAFLLAEICTKSGLPNGVLNVIPVCPKKFKNPEELPILEKLIFTGSFRSSILYSKLSAQANLQCEVLIPKRSVVIVYENADIHSAANGVLETFFNHDTRTTSGGCKVLIQENIYDKFLKVLEDRFLKSKFGSNFSQTDFSSIITEEQENILSLPKEKAMTFCKNRVSKSNDGIFEYRKMDPILFNSIQTNGKLVQDELGGPIIVTVPFRTVKESISMFNCENKGSPVSIWTEVLRIALEVSQKVMSGVIWINSENIMDPRFPYSGIYLSGNSLEGGKDAIFSHMSVVNEKFDKSKEKVIVRKRNDESSNEKREIGYESSDVLTAVTKASSSQPNWETVADAQKRRILTITLEKLNNNVEDYIVGYQKISGMTPENCRKEFDNVLTVLYYWSMQFEKYNEPMKQITSDIMVVQNREPLGVIGIQCPDENPLLSFISLVVPAVIHGNAVIAISNIKYKTIISTISEAFSAANLPNGIINNIFGDSSALVPSLRKNTDVNAVWYTDVSREIVFSHSNPLQRLFYCKGIWDNLTEAKSLKYTIESTYSKSIFLPHGDIFAN